MTLVRPASAAATLAAALILVGCGPGKPTTYPVRGVVAYKDTGATAKSLDWGYVRLELASDPTTYAQGKIEDNGEFELAMYKDGTSFGGLVPGEYRARVEPPGYVLLEIDILGVPG